MSTAACLDSFVRRCASVRSLERAEVVEPPPLRTNEDGYEEEEEATEREGGYRKTGAIRDPGDQRWYSRLTAPAAPTLWS